MTVEDGVFILNRNSNHQIVFKAAASSEDIFAAFKRSLTLAPDRATKEKYSSTFEIINSGECTCQCHKNKGDYGYHFKVSELLLQPWSTRVIPFI